MFGKKLGRKYCSQSCKERNPSRLEYKRGHLKTEKSRARLREHDRARYANNPQRREYSLARSRQFREEHPDRMSDYAKKRRALLTSVAVDDVNSHVVYERDNWVCGVCGKPVDRLLKWPDPMSASLDHIIPISKGGEHSYANTQLAHLVCNQRKGARIENMEAP